MLETVFKGSAADSRVKMSCIREQLAEGRDFFWLLFVMVGSQIKEGY
jgi:hypothetical protein